MFLSIEASVHIVTTVNLMAASSSLPLTLCVCMLEQTKTSVSFTSLVKLTSPPSEACGQKQSVNAITTFLFYFC